MRTPSDEQAGAAEPGRARPLERDLYCLDCGYNLRGLSGDPVRCPECGYLNPIDVAEIPADAIAAQLQRMESAPAYAVAAFLWLGFMGASWIWAQAREPCFLWSAGVAALVWPLQVVRYRRSCRARPGWAGALLRYHLCGLLMIVTVLPMIPLAAWAAVAATRRFDLLPDTMLVFPGGLGVITGLVAAHFWSGWLYRVAKRPMEALQRELAVTIARERIRRKLARAPRRWGR